MSELAPPPPPDGAATDPQGGPWGAAMDVILCLLPLIFLVLTTLVGRIRLPTSTSLPTAALLMWFIRLAYLGSDPNYTNGAVIFGAFDALTPMSISAGAILLFAAMEATQCMPWIMIRLKDLSGGHPVAEVFLITWAFEYLIEGASGFGTPVALAAPMMAQMGHSPFHTVVCALIMNTLATPFGGVGTPIWFGFSGLVSTEEEPDFFITIAWKTQLIMSIAAHFLPILAASFLVPFPVLMRNWLFILLSIYSCILPAFALSFVSFEFPSLLGGLVGVIVTGILAKFRIGLSSDLSEMEAMRKKHIQENNTAQGKGTEADEENADEAGSLVAEEPESMKQSSLRSVSTWARASSGTYHAKSDFPNTFDPASHPQVKVSRNVLSIGVQADSFTERGVEGPSESCLPLSQAGSQDLKALDAPNGTTSGHGISTSDVPSPFGVAAQAVAKSANSAASMGQQAPDAVQRDSASFIAKPTDAIGRQISGDKYVENSEFSIQVNDNPVLESYRDVVGPKGLKEPHPTDHSDSHTVWQQAVIALGRTFPLWGTVLLLIITRVPVFRIKEYLRLKEPYFEINFQSLFRFRLSVSLVVGLVDILTTPLSWYYEILYVPSFIPFVLVSTIAVFAYRKDIALAGQKLRDPYALMLNRVSYIMVPLIGALMLVSLIRFAPDETASPAYIIGYVLSTALRQGWLAIVCFVGALGSFFSGSTTTSNLTFGSVNMIAAENLGLDPTALLAMQCAGATLGNMVCINNIISAKTVMGLLSMDEGSFIAKTGVVCALALVIATGLGCLFAYTLPDSLVTT